MTKGPTSPSIISHETKLSWPPPSMIPRIVRSRNAATMAPRTMRIRSCSLFRRASRKAVDSARRLVMVLLPARAVSRTLFHLWPQLTSLAKSWATRELREAISHEVNRNGERSGLEGRCRTHDDHVLDGIRGTFHDVTVSFASCDIRVRGLRCTCWASRYWRLLIGAENENLTLAQLDPDRACHRDPVGRSARRDWKARADRESLPINSAILCGHIG